MSETIDLENASVNILIEVDGVVHLVAIEKDKYDAIGFLTKRSVHGLIKTQRTQNELHDFLEVVK